MAEILYNFELEVGGVALSLAICLWVSCYFHGFKWLQKNPKEKKTKDKKKQRNFSWAFFFQIIRTHWEPLCGVSPKHDILSPLRALIILPESSIIPQQLRQTYLLRFVKLTTCGLPLTKNDSFFFFAFNTKRIRGIILWFDLQQHMLSS